MTACDYPHPVKLEQGVGLHYKPFRLFRLTPSFAIQTLVRKIFFYLASNPRSRARNLGAPVKVSHPAAQRIPSHRSVGAGFRGAKDLEVLGVMDGRLRSQHIEAVVKFDRIAIDPVLEAHSFVASSPVS